MASIMDSLGQFVTPDTVGQLAGALGVDPKIAQQGAQMAAPLLLGATGRKMATPEGAAGVMDTLGKLDPDAMLGSLQKGDIGGMLGGLSGMLGGSAGGDPGSQLVNRLLGSGGPAVTSFVKQKFGFDIGPMLPMVAPILAGVVSKAMKGGNLDAAGVSRLIKGETEQFAAANPGLAADLNTALDLGEQLDKAVAAKKARYSAADWALLLKGPFAAGTAIMAASPSGFGGGMKELAAMLGTMVEGARAAAPDSLIAILKEDLAARKDELQQSIQGDLDKAAGGNVVDGAIAMCKNAVAAIRAGGDKADADAYSALLVNVATATASAAKEGGFLGFGGKLISDQEQAALDALKAAVA